MQKTLLRSEANTCLNSFEIHREVGYRVGMRTVSVACILLAHGLHLSSCGRLSSPCAGPGFLAQTAGKQLAVADVNLGATYLAQSFLSTGSLHARTIVLRLLKTGTVSDSALLSLTLQGDASGSPDGTVLASAQLQAINIGTRKDSSYTFTLNSDVVLSPGTIYWITLSGNYPPNDSNGNQILWMAHDGPGGYSNGHAAYSIDSAATSTPAGWATTAIGSTRVLTFQVGC